MVLYQASTKVKYSQQYTDWVEIPLRESKNICNIRLFHMIMLTVSIDKIGYHYLDLNQLIRWIYNSFETKSLTYIWSYVSDACIY